MSKTNLYLQSKPRYDALDGLRGVAALVVILYHCFETYIPVFGTQIVNHGYLAVDFFFVLSGFVVGYAYDDRWDRMTTWGFFKRRLVRLHPMVVLGTVLGACLFFFGECEEFALVGQTPFWKFALCFVMGLLMIPCGPKLDIRGWMETNSFNGPNWSLTLEYIGNILYAFILRKLPKAILALLCVACAFMTLDLTLGWDVFGFFPDPKYDVIGGWAIVPDQIYIAFARLLYPFICGLLISRILPGRSTESNPSGSPVRMKGAFWWAALIIVVIFALPQIGGRSCFADGLYQAVAIILLFPFVMLMGAGAAPKGRSAAICKWLGEISYPVYMVHFPFVYMQKAWVSTHLDAPAWMHVGLNIGIIIVAVSLAWGCYKLYDLPVRSWLTEHWLKRSNSR